MRVTLPFISSIATLAAGWLFLAAPAAAFEEATAPPISRWASKTGTTRAYLVAIHGLSLHGDVYQTLGEQLSQAGITVIAPDLRGYGRWMSSADSIDYPRSLQDLASLVESLHRDNPRTPVYILGESLGGSMAVRLAAQHPDSVAGLVLSAPGVQRQKAWPVSMIPAALRMLAGTSRELDIAPYLRRRFSNDSTIAAEHLSDRMVRTKFSIGSLMATCRIVKQTLKTARQIPPSKPILILQGGQDRMLKPSGAQKLYDVLSSHRSRLLSLPEQGHILLQTAQPDMTAMDAVSSWLVTEIGRTSTIAGAAGENVN